MSEHPAMAALRELVACKDLKRESEYLKDEMANTGYDQWKMEKQVWMETEYERRKSLAWNAARDVLAAPLQQEADKDGELTKIGMLIRPRSGLINFVQQIDALPLEVHETMEVFAALPSDEKGKL